MNNKLPERWCIKVTKDNIETVGGYYNKQTNQHDIYTTNTLLGKYLLSHNMRNDKPVISGNCGANFWTEVIPKKYTEITFEQFQNHILKSQMDKKIIGYKCPQDYYEGAVKKGDIVSLACSGTVLYSVNSNSTFTFPKEIVETWEPVYEEELKVGDWVYFTGKGGFITPHWKIGIMGRIKNIESTGRIELEDFEGSNHISGFRLATNDEIKEHLINVAKDKGFAYGANFIAVRDTLPNKELRSNGSLYNGTYSKEEGRVGRLYIYNPQTDTLTTSGFGLFVVYSQGKWATLKDKKKTITLHHYNGTFELEVSKEGIYYKPENKWLDIESLRKAICPTLVSNYIFKPFAIDAGCMKTTFVSEWENVLKIYDEFQKGN